MDESTSPAQTNPEVQPPPSAASGSRLSHTPRDWLMLGYLALILALASLVALLILIAYEKGPSI